MDMNETRSGAPAGQLLSRRSIVRAGATAAWTVPLVQVISVAPAVASSGKPTLQVSVTSANATSTQVRVIGTVKNPSTTASLATVTLSFTLPTPPSSSSASGGAFTGSGTTYTVSSLAPNATASFDVTFVVSSTPNGDVTASASAVDATDGSGSLPITVSTSQAQTLTVVSSGGQANSSPTATWNSSQMRLMCSAAVYNPGPRSATSVRLVVKVDTAALSATLTGNGSGWSTDGSSADKKTWYFKWSGDLAPNTPTSAAAPRIVFGSTSPQPQASFSASWILV